jgi:hypothetical protein
MEAVSDRAKLEAEARELLESIYYDENTQQVMADSTWLGYTSSALADWAERREREAVAERDRELEQVQKWADGLVTETQRLQGIEQRAEAAEATLAEAEKRIPYWSDSAELMRRRLVESGAALWAALAAERENVKKLRWAVSSVMTDAQLDAVIPSTGQSTRQLLAALRDEPEEPKHSALCGDPTCGGC